MNKFYAGIGSRVTPLDVQQEMKRIAEFLGRHDFTLRSGGAVGADMAFEEGCTQVNGKKEIYLPWKNFNKNTSTLIGVDNPAIELAKKFHPYYDKIGPHKARLLLARNGYQILGKDLNTPCEFVICWTPDGASSHKQRTKHTGGTGQAISIADYYDIPMFNLKDGLEKLKQHLQVFYNLDL